MRWASALALVVVLAACVPVPQPIPAPKETPALAVFTTLPLPSPTATSVPPPATATPPPKVVKCGEVITADTVVGNDLTCPGDGLIVGADNVGLDLGGHTLTGPGRGPWVWPNRALSSVGVRVEGKKGVSVANGQVSNFATGVLLDNVTQGRVTALTATGNFYGIYLVESTDNTVALNQVSRNTYGIHLQESSKNTVRGNHSFTNLYQSPGGYGVNLISSHENTVTENTVESNVNQGIWLINSRGNLIYLNNLLQNNPNGVDDSSANHWYQEASRRGNYWSDYQGRDANGDGIGDTPSPITGGGGARDLYPLMQPYQAGPPPKPQGAGR